ncbi:hypothetical protein KSP40_PGU015573 [Platanthera guangdongensis]|uniref:Uncharacterized protein n=1 Tax=Platanthera guangdongensis TaxID=2320717 RepID=A0ABR2LZ64_9ASPA
MADGFHGMRNDFIEFFNCIVGLSCFPVSNHDDDAQSLLLPAPLLDFSDSDLLGAGAEDRNAPAIEDAPDWSFSSTVSVDEGELSVTFGDDATFPRGVQAENVEGLDSSCSFVREQLCSTSESEENSLNIKLNKNDSEFTSSLQMFSRLLNFFCTSLSGDRYALYAFISVVSVSSHFVHLLSKLEGKQPEQANQTIGCETITRNSAEKLQVDGGSCKQYRYRNHCFRWEIPGEKSTRRRKLKSGWSSKSSGLMVSSSLEDAQPTGEGTHFDSSSDSSNWYSYSKKIEDEDVGIQKPFPNQWIMVEDHLPSLERKITRDYHDVDDCEYVILKRP